VHSTVSAKIISTVSADIVLHLRKVNFIRLKHERDSPRPGVTSWEAKRWDENDGIAGWIKMKISRYNR
jgi:hypothetical protein